MDYKDIIKSKDVRLLVLQMLNFIPDKIMIMLQYNIKQNRKLNLKNPKRYTDKLQLYKLYYRDTNMMKCADKFAVRQYVKDKGLSYILNDLIGVYNNIEDIDFHKLPDEFVIKSTLGCGGNNIIICENKLNLNIEKTVKEINRWIKVYKNGGREWVYNESKPRIIIEKLIRGDMNDNLIDYKFFCFNGKVFCLYVLTERFVNQGPKLGIFDIEFNQLDYYRCDEGKLESKVVKPPEFNKMIEIAQILSKDFPHVRVDLYNTNGKIIFGEMTFFDGSGYQKFYPDKFDFILGKEFTLYG